MKDKLRVQNFIEEKVPAAMREAKTPGLSIAIVVEGDVVYAEGFGARDPARGLPATPDTLYGIGSCTKSFVAMAIMQLVEQGRLRLDDPVSKHVPFKIGLPGDPVTVHHLLTHSSGIPSLATSTVALHRGIGLDTGVPWGGVDDFYRLVNGAQDEIAGVPGSRFFYNNAGYRMLGHVIQEVSGEPFHEYITGKILDPLGMAKTTLVKEEYERDPDKIVPHWKKPDGSVIPTDFPYPNVPDNPEFSFIAAAGGIISSVRDLTRYLVVNMEGGRLEDRRVLSPESVAKMQTLHVERPPNLHGRYGYGYGWGITEDFLGHKMVSHGGSILVSTAHLTFIPDLKLGVAMAANSAGLAYSTIAEGVFAALMGEDPMEAVPALRIQEKMRTLKGTYEAYKGLSRLKVLSRAGLLYLEQKGPFTDALVPLIPEDDRLETNKFHILTAGVRQPVEFVVSSLSDIDLYIERYRYHKRG
ncbi:MAG: serine hydrolase [Candidatus Bathyarchaeota archaeon]|nr:MAG: serine hydrolase [Candidatus Bathyarchaeota archaeon]